MHICHALFKRRSRLNPSCPALFCGEESQSGDKWRYLSAAAAAAADASSSAAVEQSFIIYSHESAMDGIFFALQMAAAGQGAWQSFSFLNKCV